MNIDSLYLIGKSHKVCQDYAIHGEIEGNPYFIVSDGCSSSKNVDIGARILAQSAKLALISMYKGLDISVKQYSEFGTLAIGRSAVIVDGLQVSRECLDATLMVGFIKNDEVIIYIYGDGVILLKDANGMYKYLNVQFTENAPYYLTYWYSPDKLSSYFYYFNQAMEITEFDSNNIGDGNNGKKINRCDVDSPLIYNFKLSDINSIVLSTDGINSFVRDNVMPYDIDAVAPGFMSFKNTKGEFLKRRIERHLDELAKQNIHHYDDIGMAGITL